MSTFHKLSTLCLAAAVAAVISFPAGAFDLKGEKVTYIVPFSEGGGSDTLARLMQPFLEKYLPGNPTIVVLNQPGGGSVKGANKFQRDAKPDGRTIMGVSTSTLVPYALGLNKVEYDVLSWRPIMLVARGTVVYGNPQTTGITGFGKDVASDIKILRTKSGLKFGAKTPSSSELRGFLVWDLFDVPVKAVFGLSTSKQRKAFFRKELELNYDATGPYATKVAKGEKDGTVAPIVTFGYTDADGNVLRDPHYPDWPTVVEAYEIINGKKPSGPMHTAFMHFLTMGVTASKSVVLPEGTPDDIVDAYVAAVQEMSQDPAFQEKAIKHLGTYPISFGADAKKVLKQATDLSPETRQWVKDYVLGKFNVKIE